MVRLGALNDREDLHTLDILRRLTPKPPPKIGRHQDVWWTQGGFEI